MKSAKTVNLYVELLMTSLILFFLYLTILIIQNKIKEEYKKEQTSEAKKVDLIIQSFLEEKEHVFLNLTNFRFEKSYDFLMNEFSDLYIINKQYKIIDIIKKDSLSKIFIGYDFSYSKTGDFFKLIKDSSIKYSSMIRSPENESVSIYIALNQKDRIVVARIGIDKIKTALSKIVENEDKIIILATLDGYILSSTSNQLPIIALPDVEDNVIDLYSKEYLFFRSTSSLLKNDIVILTSTEKINTIISPIRDFFPYLTISIILLMSIKFIFQYRLILIPLNKFSEIVTEWNTYSNIEKASIVKISEIDKLQKAFIEKTIEINAKIDEIQSKKDEILEIKKYLKKIIDSLPIMLISINEDYTIQEFNRNAELFFKINRLNKNVFDKAPVLLKFKDYIDKALINKINSEVKKVNLATEKDLIYNIEFIAIEEEGKKGVVIIFDDITLFEKVESQLRQSQKMDALGQLAGGIAHDFNNMLAAILNSAELLGINNLEDEKRNKYLKLIIDASNRAGELTKKLLAFARKEVYKIEPFSIHQSIISVVEILSRSIDKKIVIETDLQASYFAVFGDMTQIMNVLINLGINSSHAMPNGGKLIFQTNNVFLDKSFCVNSQFDIQEGTYIQINVQDTGIGISPENISKIFDPFFTTKEQGKGTGLGLSMAYGSIAQHHGAISVYSESGKGALFQIYLPLANQKDIVIDRFNSEIVRGKGAILVIDDEEFIRTINCDILTNLGYNVLSASSGAEGIKLYLENKEIISLVILDMIMPEMNGKECFYKLLNINPKVKVIIASGFSKDEDIDEMKKHGLITFIRKPFNISILSKTIAEIIER